MESQTKPRNLLQNLIPPLGAQLLKDTLLYWKANSLDIKDIVSLLEPDPVDCGMFLEPRPRDFVLLMIRNKKLFWFDMVVAPYVGAWIETCYTIMDFEQDINVAPY